MKTPTPLTDEQIRPLCKQTWVFETAMQWVRIVEAARDAQWVEMLGKQEPALFIHPDTYAMAAAHVGAWKPGHELPGYIQLYTHPQPDDTALLLADAQRRLHAENEELRAALKLCMHLVHAGNQQGDEALAAAKAALARAGETK